MVKRQQEGRKTEAGKTGRAPHTFRSKCQTKQLEKPTQQQRCLPTEAMKNKLTTPERALHNNRSTNAPTKIPKSAANEPVKAEARTA